MKSVNLDIFYQAEPFTIHRMPKKQEPRKSILALAAAQLPNRDLSEWELNELLKPMYEDFVELRRYLVDYKLLDRSRDGSRYHICKSYGDTIK